MTSKDSGAVDRPIQDFSDCHVGIVHTLGELETLALPQPPSPQRSDAARRVLAIFNDVVSSHHVEEERELFVAVTRDAAAGEEQRSADSLVQQLTSEHRRLEALFAELVHTLSNIERGQDIALDVATSSALIAEYRAHADLEESTFLPLAQRILGRNGDHMAALGLALHIRHASQDIRRKFGFI